AEMIVFLIEKGADPNALDKSGVAPLHRAVRQRCSRAVDSLLRHGATVRLKNKSGSTPLHLAVQNTGRGGTGSPEAKALQREIIELLLKAGAGPQESDGRGKPLCSVRRASGYALCCNWPDEADGGHALDSSDNSIGAAKKIQSSPAGTGSFISLS